MASLQTNMPTPSSLFSAYASISTSIMLFRTMFDQLIPRPLQDYIISTLRRLFWKPKSGSPLLSLVIEQRDGMATNHLYDAAETYLCTKISHNANRLKISKTQKDNQVSIKFAQSENIVEHFEGIELTWKFVCEESKKPSKMSDGEIEQPRTEKRYFELGFDKKHKEKVIDSYLNLVVKKSQEIKDEKKVVKLYNLEHYSGPIYWDSVNLEHPSTFDTLAMDPKMKKDIIEDLDRFVERKEFYRKVGKAWKRGYLLYGPPGTGKSSLIAAIANYLKFDIYDLQLMNVKSDSSLRKLMLKTLNRSILVIEDIDCSVELPDRHAMPKLKDNRASDLHNRASDLQFSLSGLLNFIDGLWSSCGDERIIIFTTNNKDKLDPALLRPGRMDMHIHMSYLTGDGFKILASNYLDIHDHHRRFGEIEELIESMNVTPAEVAEELMKSNDAEVSLGGLTNFLKLKKIENEEVKDDVAKDEEEIQEAKKLKSNV